MNRKVFFVISLSITLTLSACSTGHDFVIINTTDGSIEVQYRIKRCAPPSPTVEVEPPSKLNIKEFQQSNHVWQKLSKEQFTYDSQLCKYVVSVGPHEALLVDQTYNYSGPNSSGSELHFDIDAVSITGAKGTIELEGRQAQTQFKSGDSGDYILNYE